MSRLPVVMACLLAWAALGAVLEYRLAPGWPPELGDQGFQAPSEVVLPVAQVTEVGEDYAQALWGRGVYRLAGDQSWSVGEEVTVGGVWTGSEVQVSWVEVHPGRPAKRQLGGVGLVGVLILCLSSWSWSGRRLRIDG